MNNFVESLKRLYKEQQITYAHVLSFYDKGKISKEAAEYILNIPKFTAKNKPQTTKTEKPNKLLRYGHCGSCVTRVK